MDVKGITRKLSYFPGKSFMVKTPRLKLFCTQSSHSKIDKNTYQDELGH